MDFIKPSFKFEADKPFTEIIRESFETTPQTLDTVMKKTENTMQAYIITMMNNHDSVVAARKLLISIANTSSNIDPFIFNAVIPATIDTTMARFFNNTGIIKNIQWTYPIKPEDDRYDIKSGLKLSHYPTRKIENRIACFLSHYSLWRLCYDLDRTIMILEHDAEFTSKFDYGKIKDKFKGTILGLNDPIGATRKAREFHHEVIQGTNNDINAKSLRPKFRCVETPWIDNHDVPQGIAGNSAYVIRPEGAAKLIGLVAEYGMWPNDAIMCKQLMPKQLQVCYPYITKVQGLKSTTSG
jgi:GR25 family glycosyltransferase involved in LPS biosynthesis